MSERDEKGKRSKSKRERGKQRRRGWKTEIDRRGSKCDRVTVVGVAMTSWIRERKGAGHREREREVEQNLVD